MTPAVWGALLGLGTTAGGLLVVARVVAIRRPRLETRVLPYLRDLDAPQRTPARATGQGNVVAAVFGPALRRAADVVERVLGGTPSVRRWRSCSR